MEGGDIYRAASHLARSLRSGSSSVWRNTDVETFSRKGILTGSHGSAGEIDVHNLGWQQRKALLERLVKVAEEDNEKFLLKLKNRIARSLNTFIYAVATEGQEANVITDYIIKVLGLEVCADTMVGDEMLRGFSGGQRKSVTTGELMVGPARALFMDETSTGLDSSTTFQIVNSLKQSVPILDETAVISLLQPAPETYDLFDDIILLADGRIVYHGPHEDVLSFFEDMGFKCPERKRVADFLQEQHVWSCYSSMPTEVEHNFSLSVVTVFVNMFAGF
ncbi:Detected protein of unknown function [Hibiscus syriacus]|uniref:ABC transporter domain-containing protein n=1 Tax=Hibiscus syriacus TaxID=106335 RepID=A0A6A3BNC8_HIBSY|nr:Detected protein of unknown function [Hibiscus syriacus]